MKDIISSIPVSQSMITGIFFALFFLLVMST